jgi:hypothetical protein
MPIEFCSTPIVVAPAAGSASIVLTPGSPIYTNSAWGELIASTGSAITLVGIMIGGGPSFCDVDIGVGGAGSEVVVGTLTRAGAQRDFYFPIPIDNVASGVRVSARIRGTATTAARVRVLYYEGTGLAGFTATAKPCITLPIIAPAGTLVDVNSSASAWANGAWAQLVASVSNNSILGAVMASSGTSGANVEFEVDLGIGAAASEVVFSTFRGTRFATGVGGLGQYVMKPPYDFIPSGSRLSARVRCEGTTIAVFRVFVSVYEKPV